MADVRVLKRASTRDPNSKVTPAKSKIKAGNSYLQTPPTSGSKKQRVGFSNRKKTKNLHIQLPPASLVLPAAHPSWDIDFRSPMDSPGLGILYAGEAIDPSLISSRQQEKLDIKLEVKEGKAGISAIPMLVPAPRKLTADEHGSYFMQLRPTAKSTSFSSTPSHPSSAGGSSPSLSVVEGVVNGRLYSFARGGKCFSSTRSRDSISDAETEILEDGPDEEDDARTWLARVIAKRQTRPQAMDISPTTITDPALSPQKSVDER